MGNKVMFLRIGLVVLMLSSRLSAYFGCGPREEYHWRRYRNFNQMGACVVAGCGAGRCRGAGCGET